MAIIIIIILGIIQGACEFLPVSSSGHLVVFYNFFGINQNVIMLSIILHLATLCSVVFVYRKDLVSLLKNPFCKTNRLLLTGTIPTVIIVLIFEKFIENSFSGDMIIYSFLFTATLLFVAELMNRKRLKQANLNVNIHSNITNLDITYKQAVVIGLAQGVATIPGVSRSGATISAGLLVGVNKSQVAHFSFLLSVPIIIASLGYQLIKVNNQTMIFEFNVWQLAVGFAVAFLVGLLCLKVMINFVKQQKLYIFSVYLVLLVTFLLLNKYVLFWL